MAAETDNLDTLDEDALEPDDGDEQTDEEIIREAHKRFLKCEKWEAIARRRWLEDYKFANGDSENNYQWPDQLYVARTANERPALTINKTQQHCLQIINDAKQNKSGIKYRPVGDGATKESADAMEGIARHIQDISHAQNARGTAIEFQVYAGMGYTRIVTEYESETSFNQEIYLRPVDDPLSCYLDPDITQADGSDARFGFVFADRPRDEVLKEYPEFKDQLSPTNSVDGDDSGWLREDHIRIAEYYRVKERKDELIGAADGTTAFRSILTPALVKQWEDEAAERGEELQYREVIRHELQWVKIVGNKIAERRPTPGKKFPGKSVPIVPYYGIVTVIEGQLDRRGHTRALIDPQKMYNYNRPLALDTPLPTPNGWTTMGDVEPGDFLFDERGKPCEVKGVSPVFTDRKCYRVTFDDGTAIVADEGHPWTVERRGKRNQVGFDWRTETLETAQLDAGVDFICTAAPLELGELDLPVDPYLLGLWLGDGASAKPELCGVREDLAETRDRLLARGHKVGDLREAKDHRACYVTIHGLLDQLREAGVFQNKHIPPAYLRGSRTQREALLQGLMDTDGCFNPQCNQAIFINCNTNLAHGVAELTRSLGLRPKTGLRAAYSRIMPNGKSYECRPSLRVTFTSDPDQSTFLLSRKRAAHESPRVTRWRRTKRIGIKSVVEVSSVPVRCVCINTNTHLFLAGESMVPTHNSAEVEFGALQSKTPYLVPVRAIEGLETYWATANRENHAYLPWNDVDDDGQPIQPPQRQEPPAVAPVYAEGAQAAERDMMIVSGQYEAEMGAPSNEVSGRAINERQRQGDRATYHFIDSQAIAIRREGQIIMELIPEVYDTPRIKRILADDGEESQVHIDPNAPQAHQVGADKVTRILNPRVGRYEVVSDVGPDYATQRQEAFEAITQIIMRAPQLLGTIGDLLFKVADFPMADKIAERLKPGLAPEAQQAIGKLQEQLQNSNKMLGEAMQALTEERLKVKARDSDNTIKAYEADTRRLGVIKDMIPLDPADMQRLIHTTVQQALQDNLGPIVGNLAAQLRGDMQQQGTGELPIRVPDVGQQAATPGGADPTPAMVQ